MEPGRQSRVTAKLRQPAERADESVLRQLARLLRVAAHAEDERVHAWRVRVVELAPRQAIARNDAGDELSIVHPVVLPAADPCCDMAHIGQTRASEKAFGGTAT